MSGGAKTLVARLRGLARARPADVACTFVGEGELDGVSISFEELDRRATVIAARLRTEIDEGERVLLSGVASLDAVVALVGCLYASLVPLPAFIDGPAAP